MSTIAAKYSAATMQFKVGTAAVALVAAASITPAIAQATPDFIPVTSGVASIDVSDLIIPGGLNASRVVGGGTSTAAVVDGPAIFSPIGAAIDFAFQAVGGVIWVGIKAFQAGAAFFGADVTAAALGEAANAVALFFRVGPYAD